MVYDIVIIGGGPAGLTAGIYAGEAGKSVIILEKFGAGGQTANINKITNYSGFLEINGFELSLQMQKQAQNAGAEFKREEVVSCSLDGDIKTVKTHKAEYQAKNIIIATGAYAKMLDVQNEREFFGRGVSYCATCDGNFFKDKTVAVVGGGNVSFDDCLYLYNLAKKIYIIHRRDQFTATDKLKNKVMALVESGDKIEVLTNTVVSEIVGDDKLSAIKVQNKKTGEISQIDIDGLFVAIGRKPDTDLFGSDLDLDENGFIITDENMKTNIDGVYAVGDVRKTPLRQIITACADGAVAVSSIIKNG